MWVFFFNVAKLYFPIPNLYRELHGVFRSWRVSPGGCDWVPVPEHVPTEQSSSLSSILMKHSGIFTSKDSRGYIIVLELVSGWSSLQDKCLEEEPGQASLPILLTGSCSYR